MKIIKVKGKDADALLPWLMDHNQSIELGASTAKIVLYLFVNYVDFTNW